MWWFIVVFIDFGVALLFFISLLGSFTYWIHNRKDKTRPFEGLCLHVITALIIICAPSGNLNKSYPKGSYKLLSDHRNPCKCNLSVEYYCIYRGGATTTDLNAVYLTDSANFRHYIGQYDEGDQAIKINCNGDSVVAVKTTIEGISTKWTNPLVLDSKSFSLNYLTKEHSFQ